MGEINVIQICDHTVTKTDLNTSDVPMTRGEGIYDVIPINGYPRKIILVTDNAGNEISSEIYNLYGNRIVWTLLSSSSGVYKRLNLGDQYVVNLQYNVSSSTSYRIDNCPKCGGLGWYADITSAKGVSMAQGSMFMTQRFLKCLLTQRGTDVLYPNYGASLQDVLGGDVLDSSITAKVTNAVKDAERQIISAQESAQNLALDEILVSAKLNDLEAVEDGPGFFLSISLTSAAGKTSMANLTV